MRGAARRRARCRRAQRAAPPPLRRSPIRPAASAPLATRGGSVRSAKSSPSASNCRAAASRCFSASCTRPRRASAASSVSCARRSKGASCSHFSTWASDSSSGALVARRSRSAACALRKRRRSPVSQPPNAGLRSISRPSSSSPWNSSDSTRACSPRRASIPSPVARAISTASTRQSERSSSTMSSFARTRGRSGSSTRRRSLVRHQRSSPRGSLGRSQSSSQSRLREAPRGASARYASSPRTLRDAGSATTAPRRRTSRGPSIRTSSRGGPPERDRKTDSTRVSTAAPIFGTTPCP